ncbi:MAG: cation diffusion facilitator family transporter [Blastocatellia bacterium]
MATESRTAIYAAMFGNLAIAVTKFAAAFFSGSSAMTAEAIHSLVDTGNEVLLLYGLRQSRQLPDQAHPFGYGREIYFWSFVVAVLIFALGGGMSVYEGITHLIHPHPVEDARMNFIVLGLAAVFEGISWYYGWRAFRTVKGRQTILEAAHTSKDPTSFLVVFEDSAALLGLLIAFVGVWLGQQFDRPYFDGAASITIGLVLSLMAVFLAWESKGLLIGEGVDRATRERILSLAASDQAVERVDHALTMYLGPHDILLTLEVRFRDNLTSEQIRTAVQRLAQRIREEYPDIHRIFFESTALAEKRHEWLQSDQSPAR